MTYSIVERGPEKYHLILDCDACPRRLLLEGFKTQPSWNDIASAIHHHTYWSVATPTKKHPELQILCSRHPKGEHQDAKRS